MKFMAHIMNMINEMHNLFVTPLWDLIHAKCILVMKDECITYEIYDTHNEHDK